MSSARAEEESEVYKNAVGGKLSLKGIDLKKKKKKKHKHKRKRSDSEDERHTRHQSDAMISSHHDDEEDEQVDPEDFLTDAEKRYRKAMRDREVEMARDATRMTHREKIEEFNAKLGALTEHNDIPRVSAAGNG